MESISVTAAARYGSGFQPRWPPEIVEAAFETWVGIADRNLKETSRRLSVSHAVTVPIATLALWRDRYDWPARRMVDLPDAVTIGTQRYVDGVWVAALDNIKFLSAVRSGDPKLTTDPALPERIRAAIQLDNTARSLLLKQAELSKVDGRRKSTVSASQPVSLSTMSSDELEAEAQRRRTARQERDS